LAQGQTQGSSPRVHQQALTTGPFGNTCEADAVSPEASMGGLQDKDVYNQGEYQVDLTLEQYNMHISLISLDLLHTTIYQIYHSNAITIYQREKNIASITHYNTRYTWFTLSLGLCPQNCAYNILG
jgi:hypothetical protein